MFRTPVKAAVALLALIGSIGIAVPAQAAVYRGTWDPGYGAPFDSLGWTGTATFFLPDACVGITGTCTDPGMAVLGASVNFYDVADPGHTVLQTLVFNPSPDVTVYGMTVSNNQLTGVDTGFFNPVKGDVAVAQYNGADYYFQLVFHGAQAQLFYTASPSITPACASGGFGGPQLGVCGYSAQVPDVIFAAVPEPATYVLMFAGLAAVGVASRRRSN
jgi:hypothetical protein